MIQQEMIGTSCCCLCKQRAGVTALILFDDIEVSICGNCRTTMVTSVSSNNIEKYSERYEREILNSKACSCWHFIETQAETSQHGLSILDIGCGQGMFLDIAHEHGLLTAGIELASNAALTAKSKGHEILCGSVTKTNFSERKFDIVTLWDLLEHLDDPRQVLLNTYDSLRSDGRMFILTPMMGSIYDRLGLLLFRLSGGRLAMLVRMCWSHEHLWRFDADGLKNVLLSIGFREVHVQPILLLSLMSDRYAGGEILASWTGGKAVDAFISRFGVWTAKKFNLHNKILVKAIK
ncbi:MAG: class I SAM-dependent methyltransferase [Candidatus Electronema sp. V4]|uniref:class I SAM-dependent methyltransferase n=1 Tax=Candidatus Electronema sp. V4 TaxID=3454756 RepID=UPI00405540F4